MKTSRNYGSPCTKLTSLSDSLQFGAVIGFLLLIGWFTSNLFLF